jgi:3-hydroxyacyl-CoA dehydrogenase
MRIGILGSCLMGSKLGTLFARAGHDVIFSYARDRKKLERLGSCGPRRATNRLDQWRAQGQGDERTRLGRAAAR